MKVSIHPGNIFAKYGIDEGFAMLARNGIEGIQFGMGAEFMPASSVRNHLPAIMDEPLDVILEACRPYKEAAARYGVAFSQVHAPFPMYKFGDGAVRERMLPILRKSIAVCAYFESPHLIIHPAFPGVNRDRFDPEDEWQLNKEIYTALIPDLKEYKVMTLLENLFNRDVEGTRYAGACSDFTEGAQWIDRLNEIASEELFGLCFDSGHCNLARQNIYRAIKVTGKRLKALHLQDNSGHLDDHRGPYTGTVDWEGIIRGLREIGYAGDLNYEAANAFAAYPDELQEDCLHLLARCGQYMRKRIQA